MLTYEQYLRKLVGCMAAAVGTVIASILVALAIALCLNALDRKMSWFARPAWIFFLYVIPTLLVCMGILLLHARRYHKVCNKIRMLHCHELHYGILLGKTHKL